MIGDKWDAFDACGVWGCGIWAERREISEGWPPVYSNSEDEQQWNYSVTELYAAAMIL